MPVPEIRVWAIVLIVVIKTHYRVLTPKVNDRRCPAAALARISWSILISFQEPKAQYLVLAALRMSR
jgi:hypothetical protein